MKTIISALLALALFGSCSRQSSADKAQLQDARQDAREMLQTTASAPDTIQNPSISK